MVGNSQCTKKFQRKTDLDRHVDSVSFALWAWHWDEISLIIIRCVSKLAITNVTCAAIDLRGEIPQGNTRKMVALNVVN